MACPTLCADSWQLYTGRGADACAARLNRAFASLVALGFDPPAIKEGMRAACDLPENSRHGAADTEGDLGIDRLLIMQFGAAGVGSWSHPYTKRAA